MTAAHGIGLIGVRGLQAAGPARRRPIIAGGTGERNDHETGDHTAGLDCFGDIHVIIIRAIAGGGNGVLTLEII